MKIIKNKTFLSFIFPLLLFTITYLLVGFKYCTDDDGTISRIVSTGYINPFSLTWTSYFSYFLHKVIPFLSGWGLFTLGSTYLAICKLTNTILNFKNKSVKTIGLITLIVTTIDVLIQCNFTKTSFIVLCVGILSIQEYLEKKEKKDIWFGLIFSIIGFSIRPDTFYIILPFIGAYVLIKAIQNKNIKEFFKQVLIYIIITMILLGSLVIDNEIFKNSLKEYFEFNEIRSQYLDYNREKIKVDKTVDVSKITTMSENDILALNNYFFGDEEYFTKEKISKLNEEISQIDTSKKTFFSKLMKNLKNLFLHPLCIVLLYLLLISFKKKENFIYLIGVFLFTCAFTYISKFPDRIIFCVIGSGCFMLLYQLKDETFLLDKKSLKRVFFSVIVISTFIKFLIPIVVIFNTTTMPINNYIKAHNENNYLIGYSMTIERQYETNVLSRETDNLKKNFIVTSWLIKHPFYENILKERDVQNINADLIKKDNYYLVTHEDDKDCIIMEKYLEEHYYENVKYELIDEINKYKIWKFKEGVKE